MWSRRRTFLRGLGCAASVGIAGCSIPRGDTRVPTLVAGSDVVLEEVVPAEWKSHVETVRTARQELGDVARNIDGVVGLKVVRGDTEYGGRLGLELGVELADSETDVDLPTAIEDVPVTTEPALDRGWSACYNDGDYDPVPGGVVIEKENTGTFGTACCRVFDDGDPRLMTAAHLWDPEAAESNPPVTQNGRYLGRVDRYDEQRDVALVDADGALGLAGTIELVSDERLPVGGVVSDWGLAVLLTSDRTVHKIGTASGLTAGRLTAKDAEEGWNVGVDFGGNGVEAEYRNVSGDSGGPVFYEYRGEAYLVSVQQMWVREVSRDCEDRLAADRGRGTAADHVREALDVTFVR